MDFPESVSFTVTNACNLRCKMCGQWGPDGYIKNKVKSNTTMSPDVWKKMVDELVDNNSASVLLRGGEVFLYPYIAELLHYIHSKNIFISIDTNGTLLDKYADLLSTLGTIHLSISIDGPPHIHDKIRGDENCFERIEKNLEVLRDAENRHGQRISKAFTFTLSSDNYLFLGQMPDIARRLEIETITVVPRYWVPGEAGKEYENWVCKHFEDKAFSWKGFHEETPKIDCNRLTEELQKYEKNLGTIKNYPYMELSQSEYREWFTTYYSVVKKHHCSNTERLIDIQPNGDANVCVDFPDIVFGNVQNQTIREIWNGKKLQKFRKLRKESQTPVCYRCGAKYMSESPEKQSS
ncbi:radical SAM protein [Chitinispirillales bacterium ANBcel5]|uniref:radical SAM protein n=1 Tax=Cellulosispirillum alkaliphilum TaxID=3039283 RepID=UPI002A537ED3|nr:radical SAM protein [Chitinispirillales bacterium ANBcel5]